MRIWSKLFGNPMLPLSKAIIKAVRQDGFGISGYINRAGILALCKLEFFYFYLSYVEQIAQSNWDTDQFSLFNSKLKWELAPQVIDSIIGADKVPLHRRTTELMRIRKDLIDDVERKTEPYRLSHRPWEMPKDDRDAGIGIPLKLLAVRIANISGNNSDEFHAGVINLVSYDLVHLDLEKLVKAAAK